MAESKQTFPTEGPNKPPDKDLYCLRFVNHMCFLNEVVGHMVNHVEAKSVKSNVIVKC